MIELPKILLGVAVSTLVLGACADTSELSTNPARGSNDMFDTDSCEPRGERLLDPRGSLTRNLQLSSSGFGWFRISDVKATPGKDARQVLLRPGRVETLQGNGAELRVGEEVFFDGGAASWTPLYSDNSFIVQSNGKGISQLFQVLGQDVYNVACADVTTSVLTSYARSAGRTPLDALTQLIESEGVRSAFASFVQRLVADGVGPSASPSALPFLDKPVEERQICAGDQDVPRELLAQLSPRFVNVDLTQRLPSGYTICGFIPGDGYVDCLLPGEERVGSFATVARVGAPFELRLMSGPLVKQDYVGKLAVIDKITANSTTLRFNLTPAARNLPVERSVAGNALPMSGSQS